jgi:hypothetical protein
MAIKEDEIRQWRLRAAELRAIADQFHVPSAQDGLRRVAEVYERLAADAAKGAEHGRRRRACPATGP